MVDMTETLEQNEKVVFLSKEVVVVQDQSKSLAVVDEETYQEASSFLVNVNKLTKDWEQLHKFFVQPLNDQIKRINDFFRQRSEPLQEAESRTKSSILAYRSELEKKRREEEERARKIEDAKITLMKEEGEIPLDSPDTPVAQAPQPKTVHTPFGGVTARAVWTFQIVDETQIPSEFKMVNEKAIRAAVKAGVRSISGVRIFKEETLAVR